MIDRHARIVDRALTRLKLRQLRLLVAVGTHGNIQNAARSLGVSQPAATKMIQDLELDFEVKLFDGTHTLVGDLLRVQDGYYLIEHQSLGILRVSTSNYECTGPGCP